MVSLLGELELLQVEYSFTVTQSGELDATEMGLSFDVSAWGELFVLLLVALLDSSDVSEGLDATEMGLSFEISASDELFELLLWVSLVRSDVLGELDATERGLSFEVSTRGEFFVRLVPLLSSLASSGVSSKGGGERTGLESLIEPTVGTVGELLACSKEQNNDKFL